MINCQKRDVTLSLELALDLAMQRLLIAFYRQQEVGPLLLGLPKNIPRCGEQLLLFEKASPTEKAAPTAWMRTPSKSISPSNCRSTALLWFSPMA